jgi:hypothetical protein
MRNDGVKLFTATPCYGDLKVYYKSSIGALENQLRARGIPMREYYQVGNSNVGLARAVCCQQFLQSDFTHLLFIDSDIEFKWEDVVRMLATGVEVVGATYPKKRIRWAEVIAAAKRGEFDALEGAGVELTHIPLEGGERRAHLKEVAGLPGGFLMIERSALVKIQEQRPDIVFELVPGGEKIADFFPMMRVDGGYRGEDYGFCDLCRQAGIKLWMDCAIQVIHHGNYGYAATPAQLERLVL